jgi:hypothetical protein
MLVVACSDRAPLVTIERALVCCAEQHVIPHEIRVMGSSGAVDRVDTHLFRGGSFTLGLRALYRRLGLSTHDVVFNRRTLHPVSTRAISPMPAPEICALLQRACGSTGLPAWIVVAGDAAVWAVSLHAGLQVLGRPQDRLFIEAAGQFLEMPVLLACDRSIEVTRYAEYVAARARDRVRAADPDSVVIVPGQRLVRVGDTSIRLRPKLFFWFYVFAESADTVFPLARLSEWLSQRKDAAPELPDDLRGPIERLSRLHQRLFATRDERFQDMLYRHCGPIPDLPSVVSKINAAMRQALQAGAAPYLVIGGRGRGGYSLRLPADRIVIESSAVR